MGHLNESKTLAEALPDEMARCRTLLSHAHEIGPAGAFLVALLEGSLRRADEAVMSGDLTAMLVAYQDLKGFTA